MEGWNEKGKKKRGREKKGKRKKAGRKKEKRHKIMLGNAEFHWLWCHTTNVYGPPGLPALSQLLKGISRYKPTVFLSSKRYCLASGCVEKDIVWEARDLSSSHPLQGWDIG